MELFQFWKMKKVSKIQRRKLTCGWPIVISILVIISNCVFIRKAITVYDDLMKKPDYSKELHVYKACCYYALC